ncbi:MAG: hypothetical protein QM601_06315 [Pseudoxanthomonas sp.]
MAEQLAEIDENLCRAELTATERAEHHAKRKEVWEAMQGLENQVEQLVPPEIGFKQPPPQKEGYAAATAKVTGESKSDINRAIHRRKEIWEAMHPEESGRNPPTSGRGHVQFAGDTEKVTGESKRRTNEHLARAEALGPDIHAVVGTSLDKGCAP